MATTSTFKNKLTALAVGAPLLTVGFVGLAAAPASASVQQGTGGDYRELAADAVAVVEANSDTSIQSERSADSSSIETLTAGTTILALDDGVDGWTAVLTGNVEGGGQIGYVDSSAVTVVEQLEGEGISNEELDTEGDTGEAEEGSNGGDDSVDNGDTDNSNGEWDGAGTDDGMVADDDGFVEDEWDSFEPVEIDGEERDDSVIIDEDGDTFVEVDENAGDPADIESGIVGGDSSNPASLAAMGGLGLVLVAGGAFALARKNDLMGAKQDN